MKELEIAERVVTRLSDYATSRMFEVNHTLFLDGIGSDEYKNEVSKLRSEVASALSSLSAEEENKSVYTFIGKLLQGEIIYTMTTGLAYEISNRYLSLVSYNKTALLTLIQEFFNTCIIGVYVPQN